MTKIQIKKFFRNITLIFMSLIIGIILLVVAFLVVINLPPVENYIIGQAIGFLNKEFKTQISIEKASINYFGELNLEGVSIKDNHQFDFIKVQRIRGKINFFEYLRSDFKSIKFNHILLENPDIKVITYKGEEKDNFIDFIDKFSSEKDTTEGNFQFTTKADILNGKLSIVNQNLPDPIWLEATHLNVSSNNITTLGSKVWVDVDKFSFDAVRNKEQYQVKQLATKFFYSKKGMKFDNLVLETEASTLNGSLEFTYENPKALSDFNNQVHWDLHLKPVSTLSGKDIRYFSPRWNTDAIYTLQSHVTGTLMDLQLDSLQFRSGSNYLSSNKLHLKNILNPDYEIQSKSLQLQSSNASLKSILPTFVASKLKNYADPLKTVNYKGDFKITPKELDADGNLICALGNANLHLKLTDYTSKNPKYVGELQTTQLNLSSLIKENTVQTFAGKITFKGNGFDVKNLNVAFDANLKNIHISKYHLANQVINGTISHQIFKGILKSNDPRARLTADGSVDFSSKKLKIKADSQIEHLNLYDFGLSEIKGEVVSAKVTADGSFSTINDLQAKAKVDNFILNSPVNSITFTDLNLETYLTEKGRYLSVDSPSNIHLVIDGKYNLKELPATFMDGIGGMMVGYKRKLKDRNENFTFDLEVEDSFLELFVKDISFDSGTKMHGSYQGSGNKFDLFLSSPRFSYKNISADSLYVNFNTSDSIDKVDIKTNLLAVSESFVRKVEVKAEKVAADTVEINTQFFIDKELKQAFNLNLYQTRKENDILFGFMPSNFEINNTLWVINPENLKDNSYGSYNVKTGELDLHKFIVQSGEAKLELDGKYTSINDIKAFATFDQVELARFIPQNKLGDIKIEGIANGTVDFSKIGDDIKPVVDLKITDLKLNNNYLGDLVSDVKYDKEEKSLSIDTRIVNENVDNLVVTGKITDLKTQPQLNVVADFKSFKMNFLESFLSQVVSHVKGTADGQITFDGALSNPNYNGNLSVTNFGFKVNYLGVNYVFENEQPISIYSLPQTPMNLGNIYIGSADFFTIDGTEKRTGSLAGIIQTKGFSKWYLDLDMTSDNLMLLNTTSKDNELFHGKVFAKGDVSIYGETSNLHIFADARSLKGSKLTLNTGSASHIDEESKILVFKKSDTLKEKTKIKPTASGLDLDFNVSVDENTEINIVLDDTTRDEIVARGKADNIRFQMSPTGEINMNGQYQIKYDSKYYFRTLLDKVFTIDNGSTITWTGSPYDALLDISASQTKQVSNVGDFLQLSNSPVIAVELKIDIGNTLSKPTIDFEVLAPRAPQQIKDELASKFANNPDLEKNQFAVVLLTSKFYTDNNSAVAGAQSSAYEVAIRQLVNFVNQLFPDLIQFDIGFTQGDQLSNTQDIINAGFRTNISPRWTLKTSVGVPFGGTATSTNNQLTFEGELEYDLSKRNDNSFLLRFFSRPTAFGAREQDLNSGRLQSYGAGIVYRKSFNTFREFLGMPQKVKKDKDSTDKKKSDTLPVAPPSGKMIIGKES